jgi:hypothetical protein
LRHFLASLTDHMFNCYIGDLVKSVNLTEFGMLGSAFREPIQEAIHGSTDRNARAILARHEFAQTGLLISDHGRSLQSIAIGNPYGWAQVSTIQKIADQLPSTTNALESINGHLNQTIGCDNDFRPSLERLAEQIECGIDHFNINLRHNFNRATRRAWA